MAKITTVKTFTIPRGEIERLIFDAINTAYVARSISFSAQQVDEDGNINGALVATVTVTTDDIEKKIIE